MQNLPGGFTRQVKRRRVVAAGTGAIVMAVLASMFVSLSGAAAGPPSGPSHNLADYVLFARTSLKLKGDARTEVRGGNVGVNEADPKRGDQDTVLDMCRGGSGRSIVMDKDSQIVADSMTLTPACDVGYLFTNEDRSSAPPTFVPLPAGPNVDRAGRGTFVPPIVPDSALPPMPDLSLPANQCNPAAKVRVEDRVTTPVLPPGQYGDAEIDGTLTLGPGRYVFCQMNINQHTRVVVNNPDVGGTPTIVEVVNDFEIKGGTFGSAGACNTQVVVSGATTKLNDSNIRFGRQSTLFGQFYTKDGDVALGDTTTLAGHVWANSIHSDKGVAARACGTPPGGSTTTTSSPLSTTTTSSPSTTTSTSTTTTTLPEPPSTSTSTTTPEPPTTTTSTVPVVVTTTTFKF